MSAAAHIKPEKQIKFSCNWNRKLSCRFFTMVRLESDYFQVNHFYQVWCDPDVTVYWCKARIHAITFIKLDELTETIARIDTGLSALEEKQMIRNMYPGKDWETQRLAVILIENIEWIP